MPEETYSRYFIICPHCGHEHRESWEISIGAESGEYECHACGKSFIWMCHRIIFYSTKACKETKVESPKS